MSCQSVTLTKKNWKTTVPDIFGKQESIQGYLLSMNLNDGFVRRYTIKERDRFVSAVDLTSDTYSISVRRYVRSEFSRSPRSVRPQ